MGKGQANYINKRLVEDWHHLQEWLEKKALSHTEERIARWEEMNPDAKAESRGYYIALQEVRIKLLKIMNDWPKL